MDEHLLRFDKNKKLTFIDFETENLCLFMEQNLPWQVACLKVQGDEVKDVYNQYIKWDRPFKVSEGAAKATRYDGPRVERLGAPWREVVETTVAWTSDCDYIVGHNILGFDIYFLREFYNLCGKSTRGLAEKIIDTHPLAKGIKLNDIFDRKKCGLLEYQYRMIHTMARRQNEYFDTWHRV
jgi:DNA polymerase III alpha subunit (gram-positive type)